MMTPESGKPRGILNGEMGRTFSLLRYPPSAELEFFIERYWIVRWDLRDQQPYVQETLPYPCVNVVCERGRSGVFGVATGKFARLLEGKSYVFGIKFKPGAFYPFVKTSVSRFTNRTILLCEAFGEDGNALEEAILAREEDDREMLSVAENFLRKRLPEQDEHVVETARIVNYICEHQEILRVDDLVDALCVSKRTMQRLFHQYVGVNPKWVIQRYRLHEVAARLAQGDSRDGATLAAELGYFDQAHFIKDFKAIIGKTPAEYAKNRD